MTLLGREAELAAIDELLGNLERRGGALLLEGDPGIGKTALLTEAGARASTAGLRVLKVAGTGSEKRIAFAGLERLLHPYLDKAQELPAPQRSALDSAFGRGDGTPPDLFLIALAALSLLAEAAAESSLLILVEDAQWLDADTSDVIAFLARRLEFEPIALLIALREGHRSRLAEVGVPSFRLVGLDRDDSARLLESAEGSLSPAVRRRLLDTAGGNPLALLELPRALGAAKSSEWSPPDSPPLTETLTRAFTDRVSALPEETRTVLIAAALDEEASLEVVLIAASEVADRTLTTEHLAPAELAGLLVINGAGVRFRHPLVRGAIEQSASSSMRQATHSGLAKAYAGDLDREVWHKAASLTGPDAAIATDLEVAAKRAVARGAPAMAAMALERAAELTAEPTARASLLLRAAEMEFDLGRSDLAIRLLAQARPLELNDEQRAQLALLVEAADEDSWSGPERVAAIATIASEHAKSVDPELAIRSLLPVARSCWWGNATQGTRDLIVQTAESLGLPDDHPALIAVVATTDPMKRGARAIKGVQALPPDGGTDAAAAHLLGTAATAVLAFDLSWSLLASAVEGLRAQGRLGSLAQALVSQAWAATHLAKTTVAESAAEEAASLAAETGQPRWATAANIVLATLAGERGELEKAEAIANKAEAELLPVGAQPMLALVQFSRGRGMVAHQRYAEGYDHLKRILDPGDVAFHRPVGAWGLADLIEAAAQLGRA